MKKGVAVIAAIFIIAIGWFFFFYSTPPRGRPVPDTPTVEEENAVVSRAIAEQNTNTVAIIQSNFARVSSAPTGPAVAVVTPPAGPASPLQVTNVPPEIAVENMSRAIHQYGEMFGGNPVGTNPEFTKQLSGDNPKHINFITDEAGMRVDGNGELVDPWGTPYFFHQISGSDTEVRSAGPDGVMYTADDIVR